MKYMVNVFPKDITPWSVQGSNLGTTTNDRDALTMNKSTSNIHMSCDMHLHDLPETDGYDFPPRNSGMFMT